MCSWSIWGLQSLRAHQGEDVGGLVGEPGEHEAAAQAVAELEDGLRLRPARDAEAPHRLAHALQRGALRELLQLQGSPALSALLPGPSCHPSETNRPPGSDPDSKSAIQSDATRAAQHGANCRLRQPITPMWLQFCSASPQPCHQDAGTLRMHRMGALPPPASPQDMMRSTVCGPPALAGPAGGPELWFQTVLGDGCERCQRDVYLPLRRAMRTEPDRGSG